MKLATQAPYVAATIAAFPLIGAGGFALTGNPQTGLLLAFMGSGVIWCMGRDKAQAYESALDDPPAKLFAVSDFEVMAAIKEAMLNNIGDKWWVQKFFDDTPDEDGNQKAKYVMTYEEEWKSKPPKQLKRQLVLDIHVGKVASQTTVKLTYQVASEVTRFTANDILEATTAMIWVRLERLASARGAR
jgi:hypothetical protein